MCVGKRGKISNTLHHAFYFNLLPKTICFLFWNFFSEWISEEKGSVNVAFTIPLKYRICSFIFPLAKRNKLPKGTKTSNQNQPCLTSICTSAYVLPCQKVRAKNVWLGLIWKQNHLRDSLLHVHFYIITFNREPAFLLEAQTIVPKCNDRDWKTM